MQTDLFQSCGHCWVFQICWLYIVYCQGWILSPCLFNLYTEYFMWNARLGEAQAEIKIARRNINNLRYADDTTLMAESEEEPNSLLMKVKKESEKVGLKTQHSNKIMTSSPITSWQIDGETMETVTEFTFIGLQSHWMESAAMKLKDAPWKKSHDKSKEHIKKHRHHFANEVLYSQSYDFCSSHVRMWELDHKKGRVPKNWWLWTVVLEKTPESPGQQRDPTSQS